MHDAYGMESSLLIPNLPSSVFHCLGSFKILKFFLPSPYPSRVSIHKMRIVIESDLEKAIIRIE